MTQHATYGPRAGGAQPLPAVLRDHRTGVLAEIIRSRAQTPIRTLLVVGCGSGKEAAMLAHELDATTTGIDIADGFDATARQFATLELGDATSLKFADASFDFVYSYHALEHIPDYMTALEEMRRVLAPSGSYCIGTPNRSRLVGYIGSQNTPLSDKLAWNIADWKARLRGRFRNEHGAHAGYSSTELKRILEAVFSDAEDVSLPYYLGVYNSRAKLITKLDEAGLSRLLFPSVYFVGRR